MPAKASKSWWKNSSFSMVSFKTEFGSVKHSSKPRKRYHVAYSFGSSFVHSAEIISSEFIVKGKDGFHVIQPTLASEESVPMHLTRRLMLIGIFLDEVCGLDFGQTLKDEWKAMEQAFKEGQEELTKRAMT